MIIVNKQYHTLSSSLMSVSVHMCLSLCVYMCLSLCVYVCLSLCLFLCVCVCLSPFLCVCLYVCLSVHLCVCLSVYVCVSVSLYVCLWVYLSNSAEYCILGRGKPFWRASRRNQRSLQEQTFEWGIDCQVDSEREHRDRIQKEQHLSVQRLFPGKKRYSLPEVWLVRG